MFPFQLCCIFSSSHRFISNLHISFTVEMFFKSCFLFFSVWQLWIFASLPHNNSKFTFLSSLSCRFRMWVTLLVLVGIVILSVKVFNVILGRVQLLGRLPGLKPRTGVYKLLPANNSRKVHNYWTIYTCTSKTFFIFFLFANTWGGAVRTTTIRWYSFNDISKGTV